MLLPSLEWMRTSLLKLIFVPLNKFLFFYVDVKLKFSHEDSLREQRAWPKREAVTRGSDKKQHITCTAHAAVG
jgi:hypothetical protein